MVLSEGFAEGAGEGVTVEEDVGGVEGDVVAGHVPDVNSCYFTGLA